MDIISRIESCGKMFAPLKRREEGKVYYTIVPIRCGSWECPTCRAIKARGYRERISRLFDGRDLYFWTLTYYHNKTPLEAWKTYNSAWNRARGNVAKQFGKFSFVKVLESHLQTPYPHLHCIVDVNVPAVAFGRIMTAAGFGYQIRSEKVTSEKASVYLRKYLEKQWTNEKSLSFVKLTHARRISFSRDLDAGRKPRKGWKMLSMPVTWANACDIVHTDIDFTTDARLTPGEIVEREGYVLIEFDADALPPGFYLRQDLESWEPDAWESP